MVPRDIATDVVPALDFAPDLLLRSQDVRLAIFDVDGVLTDGRIYIGEHGETVKAFATLDGHGLKLLAQAGIEPVVITGRDSAAVRRRCTDLGLPRSLFGVHDKLAAAQQLMLTMQLNWHQVAAMGDDWPDLPLLARASLACAPANAHAQVKSVAHYVTQQSGGHGAARELCDLLLIAGGHYARLLSGQMVTLDAMPEAGAERVVQAPVERAG